MLGKRHREFDEGFDDEVAQRTCELKYRRAIHSCISQLEKTKDPQRFIESAIEILKEHESNNFIDDLKEHIFITLCHMGEDSSKQELFATTIKETLIGNNLVNYIDSAGDTLLCYLCRENAPKSNIEILLNNGADPLIADNDEIFPFCNIQSFELLETFETYYKSKLSKESSKREYLEHMNVLQGSLRALKASADEETDETSGKESDETSEEEPDETSDEESDEKHIAFLDEKTHMIKSLLEKHASKTASSDKACLLAFPSAEPPSPCSPDNP